MKTYFFSLVAVILATVFCVSFFASRKDEKVTSLFKKMKKEKLFEKMYGAVKGSIILIAAFMFFYFMPTLICIWLEKARSENVVDGVIKPLTALLTVIGSVTAYFQSREKKAEAAVNTAVKLLDLRKGRTEKPDKARDDLSVEIYRVKDSVVCECYRRYMNDGDTFWLDKTIARMQLFIQRNSSVSGFIEECVSNAFSEDSWSGEFLEKKA